MHSMSVAASAALVAATTAVCVGVAPPARAYDPAISGTYTATVVGDWARTNTVLHVEQTVRSTWTITSSCTTAEDCSGQVTSDQGWSAPLIMHDGLMWTVKHDIPNWETCPDGTSFTGRDVVIFYPANPDTGELVAGSRVMAGREKTAGPSGACGNNKPLYIEQPFRLDQIG
jgi:hypothetical protein